MSAAAVSAAMRDRRAFIVGLSGEELTDEEAQFLKTHRPCGIIIFSRNYSNNSQLSALIGSAQGATGDEGLLVLVDQEGGRVQRLRGHEWPDFPEAAAFGALYELDAGSGLAAAGLASQWLSSLLRDVGINTNCVPCLDVPVPSADEIIGDRAYGMSQDVVTALGDVVAQGCMAGGVLPVIKHIPGHGRAEVDSHIALPVVHADEVALKEQDFMPFRHLNALPAAMSAHVTYSAFDTAAPASVSSRMTRDVIRGDIGFDGLLMSDDVSMQALAGTIEERARGVIDAGSDVILHCNGDMSEMQEVAAVAPVLAGPALRRYERCQEIAVRVPEPVDEAQARTAMEQARQALAARADAAAVTAG